MKDEWMKLKKSNQNLLNYKKDHSQQTYTCPKSTEETVEQDIMYIQS